jgi:hypothetical protein
MALLPSWRFYAHRSAHEIAPEGLKWSRYFAFGRIGGKTAINSDLKAALAGEIVLSWHCL